MIYVKCSKCGFDLFSASIDFPPNKSIDFSIDEKLIIRCAKCDQEHEINKPNKFIIKKISRLKHLDYDSERNNFSNYKQNYYAIPYFKVGSHDEISHFVVYTEFNIMKFKWRFKYVKNSDYYYAKYYYLKYMERETGWGNLFEIDFLHKDRLLYLESKTYLSNKEKDELKWLEDEKAFVEKMITRRDELYTKARIDWLIGRNEFFKSPQFVYDAGYTHPLEIDMVGFEQRELNLIHTRPKQVVDEYRKRKSILESKYLFGMDRVFEIAEAGDVEVQLKLADMYYLDKEDKEKAFFWYKKAAELGSLKALEKVLFMFLYGVSVNIDPNKVVDYCKQAAEMGSETAKKLISEGIYEKIGDLYYIGYNGNTNYSEAVDWYEKAYENGQNKGEYNSIEYRLAESYVELGKIYYNGKLKKRDYKLAISYFEKAIAINSSHGKLMLGKCYIYGYGVSKSIDDGIKLICEAAQAYIPAYEFLQQLLKKEKDTVIEYIRKYYNNNSPEYQLDI